MQKIYKKVDSETGKKYFKIVEKYRTIYIALSKEEQANFTDNEVIEAALILNIQVAELTTGSGKLILESDSMNVSLEYQIDHENNLLIDNVRKITEETAKELKAEERNRKDTTIITTEIENDNQS